MQITLPWLRFSRLLAVCACFSAVTALAAPRIVCDEPVYDFGDVTTGMVSNTFTVWNRGDAPLVTGKLRACCGGSMSVSTNTIAPGSNMLVNVNLSLNHRNGKQQKSFYIASNDPTQPYYQLRFEGNAVVPAYVSPGAVSFGELQSGDAVENRVQLICEPGTVMQITNAVSPVKEFDVSAVAAVGGKTDTVVIKTVPPLPTGVTRTTILLYTDHPKYAVFKINVSVTVVRAFAVVPNEILLSESTGGSMKRYVAVKTRGGEEFRVTAIELPEKDMKSKVVPAGPGACRIELSDILPFSDLDGRDVRIVTDHPTEKIISIPIRVSGSSGQESPDVNAGRWTNIIAEVKEPSQKRDVEPVVIDYFFEAGCPDCQKVKDQILPDLNERFKGFFTLNRHDVGEKAVIRKLFAYQEKLGITANEPVCMVVDYQYVFNGFPAIKAGLLQKIDECVAERMVEGWNAPEPILEAQDASETLKIAKRRSQGFTIGMVIVAGLTDGINPCAIASLVFLMSMLRLSKNAGRGLILMGVSYCLASFITYVAIGFGLLRALHLLDGFEAAQKGIELVLLGVLAVLALLSFRDAYRFKVGGNPDDITLQLPKGLKERAHKIMREGLKAKSLILGGLTIGILVTGIETVCTGQVLVPTLVVVIRDGGQSMRELMYLLLYNFMFILPLIVVFVLTYYGLTAEKLMVWSKKNVVFSKVLLGCFFVAMAVLVVVL